MGARPASRERKERFIESFDGFPNRTVEGAVTACLRRYGMSWLTDDQINEITSDLVEAHVSSTRRIVSNRRARERAAA